MPTVFEIAAMLILGLFVYLLLSILDDAVKSCSISRGKHCKCDDTSREPQLRNMIFRTLVDNKKDIYVQHNLNSDKFILEFRSIDGRVMPGAYVLTIESMNAFKLELEGWTFTGTLSVIC